MRALIGFASILTIFVASAPATAQPLPGFGTMDRFDEQTKFASSLSYVGFDDDGFFGSDLTAVRLDLFGQYMLPEGYGGYVMVPLNHVSIDVGGDSNSESGIGNIEAGGLYIVPGDVPVVLRGGLSLDTADEDTAGLGLLSRFTDLPSDLAGTSWLRLSATPMVWRGNGFFKGDIGIDVPIAEDDNIDMDPLIRINVGGGVQTGDLALIGELLSTISTADNDDDNRMVNLIGATARWMGAGQLQPHMTLQIPLDDEFEDLIDWNLIVGLEYVIGATDVSAPANRTPLANR